MRREVPSFKLPPLEERSGQFVTSPIQEIGIRAILPRICMHGFGAFDGPCTLFLHNGGRGDMMSGPSWSVGPGDHESLLLKIRFVAENSNAVIALPYFEAPGRSPDGFEPHLNLLWILAATSRDLISSMSEPIIRLLLRERSPFARM